ncbi:MAG: dihydrolipoamide acetyltransferase family protein [Gemmatimonadaceae bacterium]|nr:dihydrolipoamide acetyltransferase family protein [Gemmatimonadaceae bacterium]
MALVDIIMPQMGESIAEGTLSKWLKKVGDEVRRDEPIFEISTDKVDAEIPASSAGVITEIIVKEGETVAVQTVVARLETEKGAATAAAASAPAAVSSQASAGAPPPKSESTPATATVQKQSAAPAPASPRGNGDSFEERVRTRSSPLVRRIAAEHGLDIGALQGTGVAGRVTRKDIVGFIESGAAQPTGRTASMHAPGGVPFEVPYAPLPEPWPGDTVEQMSKMRGLISDHMVASRRTSAHVTSFMEVDLSRVARIRSRKRAEFEASTGHKLTYLPFIISSVVKGIKAFPIMNSSVAGRNIIYRKPINIGVAVALDWGLIVPVIKHAEDLSLGGLTKTLNDLASRARAKKLSPEEVQDGTFTITNPGVFGSLMGAPIINQPQVAIMGIGAIEKRPKVIPGADGEDTIAIRTCCYFSISFDHRIIDGAVADQFLAFVKKTLEEFPESGV